MTKLILSRSTPFKTAEKFLSHRYQYNGVPTLVCAQDDFYHWTGAHYVPLNEDHLRSELYPFMDDAETYTKTGRQPFNPTKYRVDAVLDAVRARVRHVAESLCWLDRGEHPPATEVLPCKNGLLDLRTRKLIPHTPAFFALSALDFDYDPAATRRVRWEQFLAQLWPNDSGSIDTLQEMFGYLLTSDTSQQKIFAIIGPKRSGKGTIGRILGSLKATVNPSASSLGQQFGLQALIGKDVAIIGDARFGGRSDQTLILERLLSISGEDAQTIDRKFKSAWTGKLTVRFVIISNEMPNLPDVSGAIAWRFVILTTKESFLGKENPNLFDELKVELPGILNWSLDGLARLTAQRRFTVPHSSIALRQEMQIACSPVQAFIEECCDVGPELTITTATLFAHWGKWCETNGQRPGSAQDFGRNLRACIPGLDIVQKRPPGGKPVRRYIGIGLMGVSRDVTRDSNLLSMKSENIEKESADTRDMRDSVTTAEVVG